jgi:hypothetical protein
MNTKTLIYRTATILLIAMMLFTALPVPSASAVSLNITSVATGTWEATAWPLTPRSGTITVTAENPNVVGTGTAFLTELSVGNIIKTTGNIQVGTVASITSNTNLTLVNPAATARTNIAYNVQGVGPADNVTIANGNNVTIATNAVNQTGTVTVNSGGTLTVSNPGAVFSTLAVSGTVTGTSGNAFGALTINNGGLVTAGTNGTYSASSLTINSGGTVNIARAFTVNGATSITGAISFSSTSITSRAMVFTGPVTLNGGATWTEPPSGNGANNTYDFQNDFTNNSTTFTTSDTATHTFSGTGRTISGATNTSIARVKITGTYTNNGTLTVGTTLSGAGSLTNGAAGTLTLGGTVSITTLANAGTLNKTDGGPITIALANFTNTGTLNLNGTGTITGITNNAGGTVNLTSSGSITAFNNATATSTLNILDLTVPHFGTLNVSAVGNTVNYGGAGAQTVKPITYSNLTFSGSGAKSITMPSNVTLPGNSILASGTLSIVPTAVANITGNNLGVEQLILGGSGKAPGTWGSTSSAATNTDDTYFAGTGDLNVINDARLPQIITFTSTPPANAAVGGPTYTPTATGGASGNPVTFTIDPSASLVCSISGGIVSFLANGTCVIDANQAGDATYLATSQQQSFDVKTNQTITFSSTAPVGAVAGEGTYTPTATATSSLTVTFTIDPTAASVCSISAGVVSFDTAGTCVIDADQAGDNNYHAAPQVQQSFVIAGRAYWMPWYNNVDLDTQVRFGNVNETNAAVRLHMGGQEMLSGCTPSNSPYTLAAGASLRVTCAGMNNGPVQILGNQKIVAAERVIYNVNNTPTSFSEMMALPDSQLDNTYWMPWYNNVDLDTQLRFGNVSNTPAEVHVWIGGQEKTSGCTTTPANVPYPYVLAVGASLRVSCPGVNNGPVKIDSDVNIVAAERVIYNVNNTPTSFTEMMGLPDSQLDNTYWLPWYNNVDLDTQLRFGNVSNTDATVHVWIGGQEKTSGCTTTPSNVPYPYILAAGASLRVSCPGVNNGPVQIISDVNIVAAERVIYNVNNLPTSFSEMMALPNN